MIVKQGQGVGISVETGEVTDLAITTAKLAADAVTNAKLADNAVQLENMANSSVGTSELVDASVTIDKVPQTGRAALQALRSNAANDALEFGSSPLTGDEPLTINGVTLTIDKWVLA